MKTTTVVITGATSGIGLATAIKFVQEGAFVVGLGRSGNKIKAAYERIKPEQKSGQIHFIRGDLANQDQIKSLSKCIQSLLSDQGFSSLDLLINNAGIYHEKKQMTKDGIEQTFAVNHLASFLLTYELKPLLSKAESGSVVTVSSYAHFNTPLLLNRLTNPRPYIGLLAYKRSKLCNVLFTYEFNRKVDGITAIAVDPGLVNTAIASKGSQGISHWVWRNRRKQGISPMESAEELYYLCIKDELVTENGYYYQAGKHKTPSRKAQNEDIAKGLWGLSCQLTGITWN